MKYVKLENGKLKEAPRYLIVDGKLITNPSESTYLANGWKKYVYSEPETREGYYSVADGYEESETTITNKWRYVQNPVEVRSWTPLSIKRACDDKWSEVKTALQQADLYEEFLMAQELREDDESFIMGYQWACQKYGKEIVDDILDLAEGMQ